MADTSPLNYLTLIGQADVLSVLFGRVFIPPAVFNELQHSGTPAPVRAWIAAPPEWLVVQAPSGPLVPRPGVDLGEAEALQLATDMKADALLVDDARARAAARIAGISPRGTLAVIGLAAEAGLLDLEDSLGRLRRTNFRASERVIQQFRDQLRPPS